MPRIILFTLSTLMLTACQHSPQPPSYNEMLVSTSEPFYPSGFEPQQHNVNLSSYVEQLVVSLQQHLAPSAAGKVAVASFVDFDASLTNTHPLGNQLAENFVTQLRQFGFTVIDTNSSQQLTTTASGQFNFTRQTRTVIDRHKLRSVLTGTLIYTPRGIEVNARIIELANQRVLSAATATIPYFVVTHLGQPE
jgi:TolB-like protein